MRLALVGFFRAIKGSVYVQESQFQSRRVSFSPVESVSVQGSQLQSWGVSFCPEESVLSEGSDSSQELDSVQGSQFQSSGVNIIPEESIYIKGSQFMSRESVSIWEVIFSLGNLFSVQENQLQLRRVKYSQVKSNIVQRSQVQSRGFNYSPGESRKL